MDIKNIFKIFSCLVTWYTKGVYDGLSKMSVPGFVDKSQFHACRLMFAFKKHDLP